MFRNLRLERPLAVIDLETTGVDTKTARIVEICVLKLLPDGERVVRTRRLNPGIPIPAEATAVHGITDADVADEPTFRSLAGGLSKFLEGCDLCGFNLKKYDLKVLHFEFQRANHPFQLEGRVIIDPMEIFHRYERRDLSAAVRFYLDRDHEDAHAAEGDVLATVEVLDAMVGQYEDLPDTPVEIQMHLKDPNEVDSERRFIRTGNEIRFNFGKCRGQPLDVVAAENPDYLEWILRENFLPDMKAVVIEALRKLSCPSFPAEDALEIS